MPEYTTRNNLSRDLSVLSSHSSKRHWMFRNDYLPRLQFQGCEKVTQTDEMGAGDAQTSTSVYWP
jgi:hypothetical protein